MTIAPNDMLPNCLIEAKAMVSEKFSGSYFGEE
jgi:hypothetical protein